MFEYDYTGAILDGVTDERIAKHLAKDTGSDYNSLLKEFGTPEQVNYALLSSGKVIQKQQRPEWWSDYSKEEQTKILVGLDQYNRVNPDKRTSLHEIKDKNLASEFVSGLVEGVTNRLPEMFFRSLRNLVGGYNPLEEKGFLGKKIDQQTEETRSQTPTAGRLAEKTWSKGAYEGASNIPTSMATMTPGIVTGALTGNPALGAGVSAAVTGTMFYGGTKDQFRQDFYESLQSDLGRKITPEEYNAIDDVIDSAGTESGLWESLTEAGGAAFSHLLFLHPGVSALLSKCPGAKNAIVKFIGKTAANMGEELAGETLTEKKQTDVAHSVGMVDEPGNYPDSFKRIAPATIVATGFQGAAFEGLSRLKNKPPIDDPPPVDDPDQEVPFAEDADNPIINIGDSAGFPPGTDSPSVNAFAQPGPQQPTLPQDGYKAGQDFVQKGIDAATTKNRIKNESDHAGEFINQEMNDIAFDEEFEDRKKIPQNIKPPQEAIENEYGKVRAGFGSNFEDDQAINKTVELPLPDKDTPQVDTEGPSEDQVGTKSESDYESATKALSHSVKGETSEDKLQLTPGTEVTYKTKKGTETGEVIRVHPKDSSMIQIKKANGKTTYIKDKGIVGVVDKESKPQVKTLKDVKKPEAPDITTKRGTPFKAPGAAKTAIAKANVKKNHEVVNVDGGWVGREKVQEIKGTIEDLKILADELHMEGEDGGLAPQAVEIAKIHFGIDGNQRSLSAMDQLINELNKYGIDQKGSLRKIHDHFYPAEEKEKSKTDEKPVGQQKPKTTIFQVSSDELDYQTAYDAHRGSSHTPEKRAKQEQQGFVSHMQDIEENLLKSIDRVRPEDKAELLPILNGVLSRYKDGYLEKYTAYLQARSKTISPMVTGPANFPTAKNRKALDREQKVNQDLQSWKKWALKDAKKQLGLIKQPILSNDPAAIEKLQDKLSKLEATHQQMKDINKIVRNKKMSDADKITAMLGLGISEKAAKLALEPDFAGRLGIPGYALTNNNANMKSTQKRIADLQSKPTDETTEIEFDGGLVVDNVEDNRVQIIYDDKPDTDIISSLKKRGFRWAPSAGAWQRKRTKPALYDAQNITGATGKTGAKYKAWLIDNAAGFGVDSSSSILGESGSKIKDMNQPILVRRRITQIDNIKDITEKSNEPETAKMSATEQAVVDAGNLSSDDIGTFRPDGDGNINATSNQGFVNRFLDKMGVSEKPGYVTSDGKANKQLIDRIQAAVFHKAYGSDDLLTMVAEEADPDIKNILNGLTKAANSFAKARGIDGSLARIDIVDDLVSGINLLRKAKAENQDVKAGNGNSKLANQLNQSLSQGDMFAEGPSDAVKQIAGIISENIRSGKRVGEFIDNIGVALRTYLADLSQMEMFGAKQDISTLDLIARSKKFLEDKYESKELDIFGQKPDTGTKEKGKPSNFGRGFQKGKPGAHPGRTETGKAEEKAKENPQYSITSTIPWKEDFPNIKTHTTVNKVAPNDKGEGGHPDHPAAKAGDYKAASRLVTDVVKPDIILELKKKYPNATVVPVWAQEASGVNMIPGAFAQAHNVIAGFKVNHRISQTNKTSHTKKNAAQRIISRVQFQGKVIKGMDYILADDIITTGETLFELKHYIENNGGNVVAVSTLGAAQNSQVLAMKPETHTKLKDKFNEKELRKAVREFNIVGELQALTESEAKYILKFRDVDSFRAKIIGEAEKQGSDEYGAVFKEAVQYQITYHGTPHQWQPEPGFPYGRPRLDKIGTGEGNQAYGFGWYSAESNEIATEYSKMGEDDISTPERYLAFLLSEDSLSDVISTLTEEANGPYPSNIYERAEKSLSIAKSLGRGDVKSFVKNNKSAPQLYKLDIPDAVIPQLLDWDAPFNEQSEYVRTALTKVGDLPITGDGKTLGDALNENIKGMGLHNRVVGAATYDSVHNGGKFGQGMSREKAASEYLASIGIPGNKYLDGSSRNVPQQNLRDISEIESSIEKNKKQIAEIEKEISDNKKNKGLTQKFFDSRNVQISSIGKGIEQSEQKISSLKAGENLSSNYVIWDQKVLDRVALLERNEEAIREVQNRTTTTPTKSNSPITPEKVKIYFKSRGLQTGTTPDGKLWVRTPAGLGFTVETVDRFSDEEYQIAINSGAMNKTGHIAGNLVGHNIKLAMDFADGTTLDHELFHLLENAGILTKKETFLLTAKAKQYAKKNSDFKPQKDQRENRANYMSEVLDNREQFRGTPLGNVLQKVADFIDALYQIARETMGKDRNSVQQVARGMETGSIYNRDGIAGQNMGEASPAYQAKRNTETPAFKKWFGKSKVVNEEGDPLVVYHGTPASGFDEFMFSENEGKNTLWTNTAGVVFFVSDPEIADVFSKPGVVGHTHYLEGKPSGIYPAYLNISNPYIVSAEEFSEQDAGEEYQDALDDAESDVESLLPDDLYGEFDSYLDIGADEETMPADFLDALQKYKDIYREGVEAFLKTTEEWNSFYNEIKQDGYDGIVIEADEDLASDKLEFGANNYVVFNPTQIKSTFNKGTWSQTDPRIQYSFAGKHAKGANRYTLREAEFMKINGSTKETIWDKTGWWEIVPGQWSFEFDDSDARVDTKALRSIIGKDAQPITNFIHGGNFSKQYPDLANIKIRIKEDNRFVAAFDQSTDTITLSAERMPIDNEEKSRRVFLHEIQHAIQKREGFARGGAPDEIHVTSHSGRADYSFIEAVGGNRKINRKEAESLYKKTLKQKLKDAGIKKVPPTQSKWVKDEYGKPMSKLGVKLKKEAIAKYKKLYSEESKTVWEAKTQADQETRSAFYKLITGEAESRLTEARRNMSDEERRSTPPWVTLEKMLIKEGLLTKKQTVEDALITVYFNGDNPKDPRIQYSTTTPEQDVQYEENINLSYSNVKDFFTGVFQNRKDKGKNYKDDLSAAALSLGSPLHNADKMGGAYGRLYNFIRRGPDIKTMKQNDLWKEGDCSLLDSIGQFAKKGRAEYVKLGRYLRRRDINQIGPKIQQEGDEWVTWTEKNSVGKRTGIGHFQTEREARLAGIEYEVEKSGFSDMGKESLRSFRKIALNNYDYFMEGITEVIKQYDLAGMPLPQVATETESGIVKVSLEVAQKQLGDHTGYYFPRIRQNGEWNMFAEKAGKSPVSKYFNTKAQADGYKNIYEKRGYKVSTEKVGMLSEDIFQSLSPLLSQEAVFNRALEGVKSEDKYRTLDDLGLRITERDGKTIVEGPKVDDWMDAPMEALGGKYDPKLNLKGFMPGYSFEKTPADMKAFEKKITAALMDNSGMHQNLELEFAKSFAKEYDAVLKSHGSRARMISRSEAKGLDVAQGYETDPHIAIARLSQATAGGHAKKQIAQNGIKIISGQDLSWNDFKANNGDVAKLEEELASEDLATPKQDREKQRIRREIAKLRKEIGQPLPPAELTEKHQKLVDMNETLKDLTRWRDRGKARTIKQRLAQKKVALFQEWKTKVDERRIDPARQRKTYADATTLLQDVLKNDEATDRVIGTLKGLAVWQYLGFRVSSPAVNLTNMVMAVPAVMKSRGGVPINKALKHVGKAGKMFASHRRGNATGKVKQVFDEIREKGWDEPKFNREAFDALQSQLGKGWSSLLEKSMWMFGATEKYNRATTIAGAYFAMEEQNQGEWDHVKMMEKAKDISDHAHGEYGKANRPYHMRGTNVGARILQMSYVFNTFSHNYIQEMMSMGMGKKKDLGAALWMVLSPAVIGGIASSIPIGIAKALANAFGGDDPEEMVIEAAKSFFGDDSETFMRFGAASLAGISLKGSLAQRFALPEKFADIFGAPGAVIGDWYEGMNSINKGFYREGFEKMAPAFAQNVSRGEREYSEGVTTRSGSPVFFGRDRVKADTLDMIMRWASFNPVDIAGKREVQWKEYLSQRRWQEKKGTINKRFKRYFSKPQNKRTKKEYIELLADVRDFNETIRLKGLRRIIGPITKKSIKASLRNLKPKKSERDR